MSSFHPDNDTLDDDGDEETPGFSDEQLAQLQQLLSDTILLGLREGIPADQRLAPPIQWFRGLSETERGYVEDIVRSSVSTALAAMQEIQNTADDLVMIELDGEQLLKAIYAFDPDQPTYVDLAQQTLVPRQADDPEYIEDENGMTTHVRLPDPEDFDTATWLQDFLEDQPREIRKSGLRLLEKKDGHNRCVAELREKHPGAFDQWMLFHADQLLQDLVERLEDVGFALEVTGFSG